MKSFFRILLLFFLIFPFSGCSSGEINEPTELTISAASSMTESLLEIKELFEKEYPDIQISYNFGGSGALRKQIEQAAPIDLFFSASKSDYEKLEKQGMVQKGTVIFENELVFITSKEVNLTSVNDFLHGEETIAIGTPEAVPAGTYAEEVFINLGVWDELENRIVFTKDVSQVRTLVNQGAASAGVVYTTDVRNLPNIKIIERFNKELHSPIEYFAAIIKNGEENDNILQAKEKFYQFIIDEAARDIFQDYGFQIEK